MKSRVLIALFTWFGRSKKGTVLKHITCGFLLFIFLFYSVANPALSRAEEVTLSYTASTLTFLPGRVAVDQGFFRQEGLDVKFIQMRTAALIPALANGHIDYTMSFLPPIDSALSGVPMQMLAVFVDRSLHFGGAGCRRRYIPGSSLATKRSRGRA
jgi:ABC-type nitrate/sulfonate/bicarbonate transport system substrate-binding protein